MNDKENHPDIKEYLRALKEHTPQRDPEMAAKGRAQFIAQVDDLQKSQPASWLAGFFESLIPSQAQWRRTLVTAIASVLLALLFTLGFAGVTVYASQDSLPGQPLYALKTFTEDLRLQFAEHPQHKINLLETFTQRRTEEISALAGKGKDLPQKVQDRFEQHNETMLKLAASMEPEGTAHSLAQIQLALQRHRKLFQELATREPGPAGKALERLQEHLQTQVQLTEEGLANPAQFQEMLQGDIPPKPTSTDPPGKPRETVTPPDKGKPEESGTPNSKGKPDHAGTPESPGKPENGGAPEGKGKPDEAGPPSDKGKPENAGPDRKQAQPKP